MNNSETNPQSNKKESASKKESFRDKLAMFQKKNSQEITQEKKPIQKEVKNVGKGKMAEKINQMIREKEEANKLRRRNTVTLSSMTQQVNSSNVHRVQEELKNKEIAKKEEEEQKQREIKEKKIVDKEQLAKTNEFFSKMKEGQKDSNEEKLKQNRTETNDICSMDKFKKNVQLFELIEQSSKNTCGEKTSSQEEKKKFLFDKKINNCEIEEKINLNITMKNPNKEYKYEIGIYDDEDKLISKSEKKSDKDEITLINNSELTYKFTKSKYITLELIKHINSNEKIITKKKIPLQSIISKNNNKNYEEKIENSKDNETINIGYGLSKEMKDQRVIELNFKANNNNNNNANICYCVQKDNKLLFKSASCNVSNIKKSDKIKLSDLEPEFEISFISHNNEKFKEQKVKIKTEELKNGVNIDLPNIDNLNINISSEETKYTSFIELLEKKNINLVLSIAIDFTGSNGNPQCNWSLHKIKDGFMNNYEKAMREFHKIISPYNKQDKYNVYGFGADIDYKFKEIFNLNRLDDPSIIGIENIISEYKNGVMNLIYGGHTFFAPVIQEVKTRIEQSKDINSNYHILLIISDGGIEDREKTIDRIIEASKLPISFIIIGIGAHVTDDMKILNGEKGKLISSNGEKLNKDIVQYVHFNDYGNDLTKLADDVLKYIPAQITSYFRDK